MQNVHINMVAIIIAVVANFVLGFIWYTPLFGKAWAKELGIDTTQKPPSGALMKGMVFMIIGSFFTAWVFAHNIKAWDPETWGQGPSAMSPAGNAFAAGIFTWLGFFFPVDLGAVAWENRSWKLFFINTGYHLVSMLVMAMILCYMK
jgi:hypothetical protein